MTIQERIQVDNTTALRDKNTDRRRVLSFVLAALIGEAKNKKVNALTDEQAIDVLMKQRKQTQETADALKGSDRTDDIATANADIAIIEEYLPKAPTEEAIRLAVRTAINATGASSVKDMGKVMSACLPSLPAVDKGLLSKIAKEMLSQ